MIDNKKKESEKKSSQRIQKILSRANERKIEKNIMQSNMQFKEMKREGQTVSKDRQFITEGYKKALLESKYKVQSKKVTNGQSSNQEFVSYLEQVIEEKKSKKESKEEKKDTQIKKNPSIKTKQISKPKIQKNNEIRILKKQIQEKKNLQKLSKIDKIKLAKQRLKERKLKKLQTN